MLMTTLVSTICVCLMLSTSGSIVALPLSVGQSKDSQTIQPLQGNWVGGFMLEGSWVTLNMSFVSAQDGIDGETSPSMER